MPTPSISSLTPSSGAVGSSIVVAGSNFGSTQGTVTFNGTTASISSWATGSITASVPTGATTGNVVVNASGVASNGVSFTVTAGPNISGLSPGSGAVGASVTVTGTNFGSSKGNGGVTFNGTAAAVSSWGNTSIAVTVPLGATTGNVIVTAAGGDTSNGVSFTVLPPYSFSVTYAPDGAILTANDSVNGNWTYTYDDFARLITATNSAPTQGFSYVYDQYGNRWQQNLTAGSGGTSTLTFSNNTSAATYGTNGQCYHAAGVTNQPDGYCYDAAGNLLNDGTHSYTYDAENRIISVDGGSTATYTYNGSGQRIRKVSSAGTEDYLYDLGGNQITDVGPTGGWIRGEVYLGARHLATYRNSTTYFVQTDWQGTTRAVAGLSGAQCETVTNVPFGDGQAITGSCGDPGPMHFTGQMRDTESNLDYFGARYYASTMGRFVSPDWDGKPVSVPYADFGDPQSLNLYAYMRNRPIASRDVNGHDTNDFDNPGFASFGDLDARMELEDAEANEEAEWQRTIVSFFVPTFDPFDETQDENGVCWVDGKNPRLIAAEKAEFERNKRVGDLRDESGSILVSIAGGKVVSWGIKGILGAFATKFATEAAEATLSEDIAATFSGGRYTSTVLTEDMTAYRYSGGISPPAGRFLTTADTVSQISSPQAASTALNLPAGATAQTLNTFTIPAGTRIFVGGVAGGADTATQIFIRDPSVLIPH